MYTVETRKNAKQLKYRRLLHDECWYTVFWRQPIYLREDNNVTIDIIDDDDNNKSW
jgi:hypothetical protein